VRTDDLGSSFTKDLKSAVESKAFKTVIFDPKNVFKDFVIPEWLKNPSR